LHRINSSIWTSTISELRDQPPNPALGWMVYVGLNPKHMFRISRSVGKRRAVILILSVAAVLLLLYVVVKLTDETLQSLSPTVSRNVLSKLSLRGGGGEEIEPKCKRLGLPQPMESIPLLPESYEFDPTGMTTTDFVMVTNGDTVHYAMHNDIEDLHANPEENAALSNHDNIMWKIAKDANPKDGVFIDVDGWVGDNSIITAAMGMDTYAFEPARYITNMLHLDILANDCAVSEHLTVVNALVGGYNSLDENLDLIYYEMDFDDDFGDDYQGFTDTEPEMVVSMQEEDYGKDQDDGPIAETITLDSFFPKGTKVQNLNIDAQGFEPQVIRGAERILKENKGRLHIRFGFDEELLLLAENIPEDFLAYMKSLSYKEVLRDGGDIVMH